MSPPIPLTLPTSVHPDTSAAFVVTFTWAAPGASGTMQPELRAVIPATSNVRAVRFIAESAQIRKLAGGTGLGDKETLGEAYTQAAELGQYFRGLDALGDGLNAHGFADLADRRHHAAINRIAGDVFDELAVDLQIIDRQGFQVHEGRQAAAEIIQREVTAARLQFAHEV